MLLYSDSTGRVKEEKQTRNTTQCLGHNYVKKLDHIKSMLTMISLAIQSIV
jgi:hypothetical protein